MLSRATEDIASVINADAEDGKAPFCAVLEIYDSTFYFACNIEHRRTLSSVPWSPRPGRSLAGTVGLAEAPD